ncbi:MAG TPA: glycosyltransferase family 2 protein [bacterium]|nr:glycosyltransferase family 2 protein [bacterium]
MSATIDPLGPFFSVVMPVYNAQEYVSRAIESVFTQSDPDWELVIIDDHSTDRTPEILRDWASRDARIRVVRNTENIKIAKSLNRGIESARGKWIVRIDADDFFTPVYLKKLRIHAENAPSPDYFFSSWITVVDESSKKILDVRLPGAERIRRMMKIENFLYHSATSFSKRLWQKVGGYPEDPTMAEDVGMWIRFFEHKAQLAMIPQFLVNYRIHYSNNTSMNDAKLLEQTAGTAGWKTIRQNREWRISLYLKQKMLKLARTEILLLARMQKYLSLKNLQYFLLTFLPESFVYFFMWEFRPRFRAFLKNIRGRSIRV